MLRSCTAVAAVTGPGLRCKEEAAALRAPRGVGNSISGASTKLSENIVVRVKLWAVLLRLPPCAQPGSCRVVPRADDLWIAADDCLDDEETDNGGAAGAAGVAGAGAAAGAAGATGAAAGAAGAGFGLGAMT